MKFLLLALLGLAPQLAHDCDFLYGTWKSSMKESYEHASKNPDVDRKQLDFVKHAFGHMTITFSEDSLEVHATEEIEVIIEGNNYPFIFEKEISSLKYITCTDEFIEVEYELAGTKNSYQYFIVNENLYWVNTESKIGREYFRRAK